MRATAQHCEPVRQYNEKTSTARKSQPNSTSSARKTRPFFESDLRCLSQCQQSNSPPRHRRDASESSAGGRAMEASEASSGPIEGQPRRARRQRDRAAKKKTPKIRAVASRRSEPRPAANDDAKAPPPHNSMGSDDHQPRAYWECTKTQRRRFTSTGGPRRGQSYRAPK